MTKRHPIAKELHIFFQYLNENAAQAGFREKGNAIVRATDVS
jgi:hypothetical protein